MPVVTVQIPTGALNADRKSQLIARITDAVVEAEGIEQIRPYVYVVVSETSRDGYGLAGYPVDVTLAKAAGA